MTARPPRAPTGGPALLALWQSGVIVLLKAADQWLQQPDGHCVPDHALKHIATARDSVLAAAAAADDAALRNALTAHAGVLAELITALRDPPPGKTHTIAVQRLRLVAERKRLDTALG